MSASARPLFGVLIVTAVFLAFTPVHADASGARRSDKARHGEIVVLRDVHSRHAYRKQPPSMAIIVDPSPQREIANALGTGELTDAEYAALGAGAGGVPIAGPTTIERMTNQGLGNSLNALTSGSGPISGASITGSVSVPMGAVHGATRGIADHVTGALAQFPMLGQPAQQGNPAGGP